MKSQKDLKTRARELDPDEIRKPAKLAPAHKSGKERHTLFGKSGKLGEYDDDLDFDSDLRAERESVLDYFDTEE